jgi:hypothetical protein
MNATKQPVTDEQLAAFDFEPWKHTPDEWAPPSDAEWAQMARTHLVALRLAWAALHKTKPELMTMVEEIDEDAGNDLMNHFVGSISFFEGVLAILKGAEARILCAGSAVNVRAEAESGSDAL